MEKTGLSPYQSDNTLTHRGKNNNQWNPIWKNHKHELINKLRVVSSSTLVSNLVTHRVMRHAHNISRIHSWE